MVDNSSRPLTTWLQQLARLKPAPWHWPRAVRAAISVGLPFAAGLALDNIMTGMWIAMGALMMTTAEQAGPYAMVLRRLAIAAPMGAVGYLAGYLTGMPWAGVVVAMAGLAFGAGIVSSYSATLSIGCLQFLLTAAIAVGVPAIAPFWEPALLYLAGALFYALLLGIEAWFCRQHPQRDTLATLLAALADLAEERAEGRPITLHRRAVTDELAVLEAALPPGARDHRALQCFALARQQCDAAFAIILATDDTETLRSASRQLRLLALAAAGAKAFRGDSNPDGPLAAPLQSLATLLAGPDSRTSPRAEFRHALASGDSLGRHPSRMPDREAVLSALALSLCLALAYASRWINPGNHWFWVPLTVGLVMKPDLGSIFARALLRSIGTLAGVLAGALILILVPKNFGFALIMAILAGILPWAMQRSYALQAVVLTPLVLMLVDIIVPGTGDANYAFQRLSDTLIGGAIVMVFGYWLWPKHQTRYFTRDFDDCRQAVASYLLAVLSTTPAGGVADTTPIRGRVYARLATLRAQILRSQADPPPASAEAALWLPRLASLERMCDAITAYTATPERSMTPSPSLAGLARALGGDGSFQLSDSAPDLPSGSPERRLAASLSQEIESLPSNARAEAVPQRGGHI